MDFFWLVEIAPTLALVLSGFLRLFLQMSVGTTGLSVANAHISVGKHLFLDRTVQGFPA